MASLLQLLLGSLVLLILQTNQLASAGRCWNATIHSNGKTTDDMFVWAKGIPSIEITFNFSTQLHNDLYLEIWANNSLYIGYSYPYRFYSHNSSLVELNVQRNSSQLVLNLTILRPDLFDGMFVNIYDYGWDCYQSDMTLQSPRISFHNCPKVPHLKIISPNLPEKWVYGTVATVQCDNTIITKESQIIGRQTTITCGATAKWSGDNVGCYRGRLLDINIADSIVTFYTNTSVLLFCDMFNSQMHYVKITLINQTWGGEKMKWANVVFTPTYHDESVTCYQTSKNFGESASRTVKLNILFPPQIEPNITINRTISLNTHGIVEAEFKSNPPISGHQPIIAYKDGKEIKNVHYTSRSITNKAVLYFTNVSASDLGSYMITVHSGYPFYTVNNFSIMVYEIKAESKTPMSVTTAANTAINVPNIVLASCLAVIIIISCLVMMKMKKVWCFAAFTQSGTVVAPTATNRPVEDTSNFQKQPQATQRTPGSSAVNEYSRNPQKTADNYINVGVNQQINSADSVYETF